MSTSLSKQTVHSPFLLLDGSGGGKTGEMGGLRGELGAVTAREEEGMRPFSHQDGTNLTPYNTRTHSSHFLRLFLPSSLPGSFDQAHSNW